MELPHYFPSDINRRQAGLGNKSDRKKFRVVFQDFGSCGHVDVRYVNNESSQSHSQTKLKLVVAQKQHQKQPDRAVLCARIPTIPLSRTPAEVHYPLQDCVITDLPDLPARVMRFSRGLVQRSASIRRGVQWKIPFLKAKKTLDGLQGDGQLSDSLVDTVEDDLPPRITKLVSMHTELSQRPSFHVYNSQYSGGLLSCVSSASGESIRHLLFHARGRDLDRLALTIDRPSADSSIVPSCLVVESKVKRVFQVDAAIVQDHVFVATRHTNSCCVFSLPKTECLNIPLAGEDSTDDCTVAGNSSIVSQSRVSQWGNNGVLSENVQFNTLGRCNFKEGKVPTSVCMSPYLPGEGLFCGESGIVKLWSARQGVILREIERPARFECQDSWCHAYYANHPRHVVLADRTAVQMLDHRDGFSGSVDLFALPSRLVHRQECIMAACGHGSCSPLHLVATNHCVFMVDQRFSSSPVMSWYPDLKGPVQYLVSTDYHTDRKGVALVGSQQPAEVMCYPFNSGGDGVTMSLKPWCLSRMSDIGDHQRYDCFYGAINPLLLEERVGLTLAGLAVAKGSGHNSFLTYQADCYGEVFYQSYSTPDDTRTAVKTGVPPPGRRDQHVPPEVQEHVSSWLECLNKQVASLKHSARRNTVEKQKLPHCRHWLFEEKNSLGGGSESVKEFSEVEDSNSEGTGSLPTSDNKVKDCSAEVRTARCCLCRDYIDMTSTSHLQKSNNDRLLCYSCRDFHGDIVGAGHRHRRSQSLWQQTSRSVCTSVGGDSDNEGYAHSRVREGLAMLDKVVRRVDSYEADAFTSVHLELMKPDPQVLHLVKQREEERAVLLKELISKNHRLQERKRAAEEGIVDAPDENAEGAETTPKHSVFNSAEHQQQNRQIDAIVESLTKRKKLETVSSDVAFSAMFDESESELVSLDDVPEEISFDLFHDSGDEELEPQPQNMSQDDDDEFFGSQDLFAPTPVSQALNVAQSPALASPVVAATGSQESSISNRDELSHLPDSQDLFLTSSQKDSQSDHPGHRLSSAEKLRCFSPNVSPVSAFGRVKAGPSQSQTVTSSTKHYQGWDSPGRHCDSSFKDLLNINSPRVVNRSLVVGALEKLDMTVVTDRVPETQPSFSPSRHPLLTPQSFKFRTPDKHAKTPSPVTLPSEKSKSRNTIKKHRISQGGFC